ncbi:MAG: heme o synthase [Flavobacteriales bacterium]|nr:heme o synthase [Flavobacteriales bacterium]MDG2244910.1 heme o synthase [Flavobacteriales bacterium]
MKTAETIATTETNTSKVKDLAMFFKFRLSLIVVLSSVLGYLMGAETVSGIALASLVIGGFLLSGASNGFNQVWEKDLDLLMKRTQNRPMPQGRMSVTEGLVISSIAAVAGVLILWLSLNALCGILGIIALFFYVFLYTPMKQRNSLAVFIGAFPGAIPPMLGYVAASGTFGVEPGVLFATQFMWQFPHFWAIAWVAYDDYKTAGYKLMPFNDGRSKRSAFQILLYSLFLIPVSILPWAFPVAEPMIGNIGLAVIGACGIAFAYLAWRLYRSCETRDAKILMFASFIYLPVVQVFYVIDKL